MSAPNRYGSNLSKARVVMPINGAGNPLSATAPSQAVLYYNGAAVSASNPLPISAGAGGGRKSDGGLVTLAQNDTSAAIAFATTYTAKPGVTAVLMSPTGATSIVLRLDYSTLTTTGVTARFTAIPASGWYLSWVAAGS